MKKALSLLLALVLTVSLAGCGAGAKDPAEGLKVTGYNVDIPEGFEETELEGFELCYMSEDNSSINMNIQEKTAADNAAFDTISAKMLSDTLVDGFKESYGVEVEITDLYFTQNEVSGFPAYQYAFTYELSGKELTQLIVCVNVDKIYTVTYTDTTGEWLDAFEESAGNITFTTESK